MRGQEVSVDSTSSSCSELGWSNLYSWHVSFNWLLLCQCYLFDCVSVKWVSCSKQKYPLSECHQDDPRKWWALDALLLLLLMLNCVGSSHWFTAHHHLQPFIHWATLTCLCSNLLWTKKLPLTNLMGIRCLWHQRSIWVFNQASKIFKGWLRLLWKWGTFPAFWKILLDTRGWQI